MGARDSTEFTLCANSKFSLLSSLSLLRNTSVRKHSPHKQKKAGAVRSVQMAFFRAAAALMGSGREPSPPPYGTCAFSLMWFLWGSVGFYGFLWGVLVCVCVFAELWGDCL